MDLLEEIFDGVVGGIFESVGIGGIISSLVVWLIATAINGIILQRIGEKAGLNENWRAYFPVFADLYSLEIANRPSWNVFFMGTTSLASILILTFIFTKLGPVLFSIFALLLLPVYLIAIIVYTVKYYNGFYRTFHIDTRATIFTIISGSFVAMILKLLIGFTDLFSTQGNNTSVQNSYNTYSDSKPASILGTNGMYRTASFDANKGGEIIFGRDAASCNVIFDERSENEHISRIHCSIRYDMNEDKYYVTDKSSTGTYKSDNTRLPVNVTAALPRGTEIYLGSKENCFRLV